MAIFLQRDLVADVKLSLAVLGDANTTEAINKATKEESVLTAWHVFTSILSGEIAGQLLADINELIEGHDFEMADQIKGEV